MQAGEVDAVGHHAGLGDLEGVPVGAELVASEVHTGGGHGDASDGLNALEQADRTLPLEGSSVAEEEDLPEHVLLAVLHQVLRLVGRHRRGGRGDLRPDVKLKHCSGRDVVVASGADRSQGPVETAGRRHARVVAGNDGGTGGRHCGVGVRNTDRKEIGHPGVAGGDVGGEVDSEAVADRVTHAVAGRGVADVETLLPDGWVGVRTRGRAVLHAAAFHDLLVDASEVGADGDTGVVPDVLRCGDLGGKGCDVGRVRGRTADLHLVDEGVTRGRGAVLRRQLVLVAHEHRVGDDVSLVRLDGVGHGREDRVEHHRESTGRRKVGDADNACSADRGKQGVRCGDALGAVRRVRADIAGRSAIDDQLNVVCGRRGVIRGNQRAQAVAHGVADDDGIG